MASMGHDTCPAREGAMFGRTLCLTLAALCLAVLLTSCSGDEAGGSKATPDSFTPGFGGGGGSGWFGGGSGGSKYTYIGAGGGGGSAWVAVGATILGSEGGNWREPGGKTAPNYQGESGLGGRSGQGDLWPSGDWKARPGAAGLVVLVL
jgi:hypothetical protein